MGLGFEKEKIYWNCKIIFVSYLISSQRNCKKKIKKEEERFETNYKLCFKLNLNLIT